MMQLLPPSRHLVAPPGQNGGMVPASIGRAAARCAALAALASCAPAVAPEVPFVPPALQLVASSASAAVGEPLIVVIGPRVGGAEGLQGELQWAPDRLRLVGLAAGSALLAADLADTLSGRARLLVVHPRGLAPDAVALRFVVRAPGYLEGLRFLPEEVVSAGASSEGGPALHARPGPAPAVPAGFPDAAAAFAAARAFGAVDEPRVARKPGDGFLFGDVNLNGVVSVADVVIASNVAVARRELSDTLATTDFVVAANVAPANLDDGTALGPDDPCRPGVRCTASAPFRELDPGVISVGDVVAIARGAAQAPVAIVGQPIPGRASLAAPGAPVTGDVTASTTWTADRPWRVAGRVTVREGATLTIEAGARVEAVAGPVPALLVIERGARLVARGSLHQPIVLTCAGGAVPGCWDGVAIAGRGLLANAPEGATGAAERPAFAAEERVDDTGVPFGGALDDDDSGELRYVRIEAGELRLLGVGRATRLSFVQVHRGGTAASARPEARGALVLRGGAARLHHVVVSDVTSAGVAWDLGWRGRLQFLVATAAAAPATPRLLVAGPESSQALYPSEAWIAHATLLGPPPDAVGAPTGGTGLELLSDAPVRLDNTAFVALATGARLAGPCSAGSVDASGWRAVLLVATPWPTAGPCAPSGIALGLPASVSVVPLADVAELAASGRGPWRIPAPDVRPAPGSRLAAGPAVPLASEGFFTDAPHLGAVAPWLNGSEANPAWYMGWTIWRLP
ncbi:MAG: hypothetical protein SFU57_05005 [Gemmatimonadales bacterium]|nr:hypothetical protein [Gemmatimonadales bacterium]